MSAFNTPAGVSRRIRVQAGDEVLIDTGDGVEQYGEIVGVDGFRVWVREFAGGRWVIRTRHGLHVVKLLYRPGAADNAAVTVKSAA